MKVEWRQLLRGRDPARLDAAIYVSLTAKLLRISPGVTVLEALLVGLVGGIGAWRVQDPILSVLCLATVVVVLFLRFLPRRFEALVLKETEVEQVRRIEFWFSIHIWLASIGIGAMTARALLAFDDPILHLNLIALSLGAAVTTIRDHYRPLVPFGKTIALLGPTAVALMLTGQPYYVALAVGAVLLAKVILDLALELYRASLDVHQVLAEKARLAEALRVRADELQRLRSELIAASRLTAMGTMASALAHELNQPLAAICNYARATRRILQSEEPDAIRLASEGIGLAEDAAHRAGELVRRIRSFVSGDGTPRKPEDLAALVEEACAFGLAEERAQDVHQEISIAPNEYEVLVDRIQIQQVLINLLQNAADALEVDAESPDRHHRPRRGRIRHRYRGRQRYRRFRVRARDPVRALLDDEGQWHGHGPGDQPHHHRGARRPPELVPWARERDSILLLDPAGASGGLGTALVAAGKEGSATGNCLVEEDRNHALPSRLSGSSRRQPGRPGTIIGTGSASR